MAITGTWAERAASQAGALQQGTGWNPIHRSRNGEGRGTAPGGSEPVTDEITEPDYGYAGEDSSSTLYGYGTETGTADRPRLGEEDRRGATSPQSFPPWGRYKQGLPGGIVLRSLNHGAELTYKPRDPILVDAYAGWDNKLINGVEDSVVSDPSQYEMNTSMTQRDKVHAGSQRSGTASEYNAPIKSRIVGQKIKPFTGDPARHNAMEYVSQTFTIRPWWTRNAGTGPLGMMKPNAAYEGVPLTRNPPAEPWQGPILSGSEGGYTNEDPLY